MEKMTRKEKERLMRKTAILNAAEIVFAKSGYEHASLNEIGKLAEFSRQTLYQYFEDKADLFLTVLLKLYKEMGESFNKKSYEGKNGYAIIKQFLNDYYIYYKNNPNIFKLFYDIGKVRKLTDNPKITTFINMDSASNKGLIDAVILGIKDGSINEDIDPELSVYKIKFMFTAFFNQLAMTGDSYTQNIGYSIDDFALSVIDTIMMTLK